MKKVFLFIVTVGMVSCGNSTKTVQVNSQQTDTLVVEQSQSEPVDTAAMRSKAAEELKSWGAPNAYIDGQGFLVYEVHSTDISADPDKVASDYYFMFTESLIEGVKVVDIDSKKLLGSYPH